MATDRIIENDQFAAFARRVVRAHGRRVAAGDVYALADLQHLRDDLDAVMADAVAQLRAEPHAYSWKQIADVLGVTRQAAQQRWPHAGGARRRGGQPTHLR